MSGPEVFRARQIIVRTAHKWLEVRIKRTPKFERSKKVLKLTGINSRSETAYSECRLWISESTKSRVVVGPAARCTHRVCTLPQCVPGLLTVWHIVASVHQLCSRSCGALSIGRANALNNEQCKWTGNRPKITPLGIRTKFKIKN